MITIVVLLVSLGGLVQFFVAYCRSLVMAYSKVELSAPGRNLVGLEGRELRGDEFRRLVQLLGLSPYPGDDWVELSAMYAYYLLVSLLRLLRPLTRSVAAWAERERAGCAYFAAVALDRRMASNWDAIT